MLCRKSPSRRGRLPNGFTLIELMIAISIMALMAVLTWRGIDGMTSAQARLKERTDAVLSLQAGLNQWGADLDAVVSFPSAAAIDWDGRALRLTRRLAGRAAGQTEDAVVVAWARRDVAGQGQWLRWQSLPLQSRGDLQNAWSAAAQWAQNPGDDLKAREVQIVPLLQWQIYYFRGGSWTNPLSAADEAVGSAAAGVGNATALAGANLAAGTALSGLVRAVGFQGGNGAAAANAGAVNATPATPDGVRLVLTLPTGQPLSGTLTRDWIRPSLGGGKS